jgi:hypothetical protein
MGRDPVLDVWVLVGAVFVKHQVESPAPRRVGQIRSQKSDEIHHPGAASGGSRSPASENVKRRGHRRSRMRLVSPRRLRRWS